MSDQFPEKLLRIKVKHFNDHIMITQNWIGIDALILPLFTFFYFYILFTVLSRIEINSGDYIFIILSIIAGLLLTLWTLKIWVNRNYIIADQNKLKVYEGPIPSSSHNVNLKVINIENLYIQEQVVKNPNDSYTKMYQLHAQKSSSSKGIKIIETDNQEEALFIKRTLKDYLNIKHDLQEGEVD